MTRRCSLCGINYPYQAFPHKCDVCAGQTDVLNNDNPDEDWKERVELAKTPPPEDEATPEERWRFAELLRADYPPRVAEEFAKRRDIDLERARTLAADAGPELAERILR